MAKHPEVAPALLCKTKQEFLRKLHQIEPYAKRAQVDIMDNRFVPNKTVQPAEFRGLKTRVKLEMQLMVKNPSDYIFDCCRMGAWMIIFHYESIKDAENIKTCINHIRTHKIKVGRRMARFARSIPTPSPR